MKVVKTERRNKEVPNPLLCAKQLSVTVAPSRKLSEIARPLNEEVKEVARAVSRQKSKPKER